MTILERILDHKRREVDEAQRRVAPAEMARRAQAASWQPRGLRAALGSGERPRIVAELKRRSPSRGEIRPDFDPLAIAKAYAEAGAAALSVLTDARFFGGDLALLGVVREAVPQPVLRKDFLLDTWQIDEARVHGADAVLLIVAALTPEVLEALLRHALSRGLDALVEVHDEAELEVALAAGADLVGVNHRDLRTFEVDLGVTGRLAPRVPEGVVLVAESGISTREHVRRLEDAGADAFLVGEALMREPDPGEALRELRGKP